MNYSHFVEVNKEKFAASSRI